MRRIKMLKFLSRFFVLGALSLSAASTFAEEFFVPIWQPSGNESLGTLFRWDNTAPTQLQFELAGPLLAFKDRVSGQLLFPKAGSQSPAWVVAIARPTSHGVETRFWTSKHASLPPLPGENYVLIELNPQEFAVIGLDDASVRVASPSGSQFIELHTLQNVAKLFDPASPPRQIMRIADNKIAFVNDTQLTVATVNSAAVLPLELDFQLTFQQKPLFVIPGVNDKLFVISEGAPGFTQLHHVSWQGATTGVSSTFSILAPASEVAQWLPAFKSFNEIYFQQPGIKEAVGINIVNGTLTRYPDFFADNNLAPTGSVAAPLRFLINPHNALNSGLSGFSLASLGPSNAPKYTASKIALDTPVMAAPHVVAPPAAATPAAPTPPPPATKPVEAPAQNTNYVEQKLNALRAQQRSDAINAAIAMRLVPPDNAGLNMPMTPASALWGWGLKKKTKNDCEKKL